MPQQRIIPAALAVAVSLSVGTAAVKAAASTDLQSETVLAAAEIEDSGLPVGHEQQVIDRLSRKAEQRRNERFGKAVRAHNRRQLRLATWLGAVHQQAEAARQAEAAASAVPSPNYAAGAGGTLAAIRSCESGGNYGAVSSTGRYRGAYQFSYETWAAVGGTGDPAAASPAEQDARAAALIARAGSSPWPICGR